jgi:hypothetical protein
MHYSSKIDLWLLLVLAAISLFFLYCLYGIWHIHGLSLSLIFMFIVFGAAGYVMWLPFFNTCYVLTEQSLHVHSMFFHWQIPYQSIQTVKPCQSLLSAPALSIQRVEVVYMVHGLHESLMLSPKNQQQFCQMLEQKRILT